MSCGEPKTRVVSQGNTNVRVLEELPSSTQTKYRRKEDRLGVRVIYKLLADFLSDK